MGGDRKDRKYGLPSSCRLCKRVNIEEQTKVSQDLDP
jgi:hypothetical protein